VREDKFSCKRVLFEEREQDYVFIFSGILIVNSAISGSGGLGLISQTY